MYENDSSFFLRVDEKDMYDYASDKCARFRTINFNFLFERSDND